MKSKTIKDHLAEMRAERLRLESQVKAIKAVEKALRAKHHPRPGRK